MNNTLTKLDFRLPFFPGFYETNLLPWSDLESALESCSDEELQEYYEDHFKAYSELEDKSSYLHFGEYLSNHEGFDKFNGLSFSEAAEKVSKACFNEFFEDFLEESDREQLGIKSFQFDEVTSPKEYNFQTDKVWGKIELDLVQFKQTMTKMILENKDKFQELLIDRHKSRSGFFSFYDHELSEWIAFESRKVTSDGNEYPDEIMLETYLIFYSQIEKGEDEIDKLYAYVQDCLH